MPVLTREEFVNGRTQVVGTCTYGPCGKPIHSNQNYNRTGEGLYHEDCLRTKAEEELGDYLETHPHISPGIRGANGKLKEKIAEFLD